MAFGPWLLTGMKWLAKLRFLRGGMLDPFSWQSDRKLERRLIGEFEQQVEALLGGLTLDTLPRAVELVKTWEGVRGFGHIKERNYQQAKSKQAQLLGDLKPEARAARWQNLFTICCASWSVTR